MKILADKNGIYVPRIVIIGLGRGIPQEAIFSCDFYLNDDEIQCSHTTLRGWAETVEKEEKCFVETKNVGFLNWFGDDFAKETFAIWNEEAQAYVGAINEENEFKLKAMGPGELIADSYII